jgi:hypothetical protein
MIRDATTFAQKLAGRNSRRIVAITQRYDTLELPQGRSPLDVEQQLTVIRQFSELNLSLQDYQTNMQYVLSHQEQFKNPDIARLNTERNALAKVQNQIYQVTTVCYRNLQSCSLPDDLNVPSIYLPDRIADASEACAEPLYHEKKDSLCGPGYFNKGRGPECGVDSFAEGRDAICGVESYKVLRSAACGAERYAAAKNEACGRDHMSLGLPGPAAAAFRDNLANLCRYRGADGLEQGQICFTVRSCEVPANGIAQYKECRDASHGVDRYAVCRNEKFGVEKYKECNNQAFGIAEFRSCRMKEFGLEQCLRKK